MARTPPPPKLTHGGLNFLQKMVLVGFVATVGMMYGLPLALVKVFNIPNIGINAADLSSLWTIIKLFVLLFVLASPFFWQLVLRVLQWYASDLSPRALRESFLGKLLRNYKNRKTLSWDDHYALRDNLSDFLQVSFAIFISIAAVYFTFTLWANMVAGLVSQTWLRWVLLLVPYGVLFFSLLAEKLRRPFENLSEKLVGDHPDDQIAIKTENTKTGKDDLKSEPPSDDFSYNPAVFDADQEEKSDDELIHIAVHHPEKLTAEEGYKALYLAEKLEIEVPELSVLLKEESLHVMFGGTSKMPRKKTTLKSRKEAKSTQKADDRHPDDATLWEVVNDAKSTSEERKTALEMIMEREEKRKSEN